MSAVAFQLKSVRRRRRLFPLAVASPPCEQGEAGGSPGQGKNNILCVLCASVVNLHSALLRVLSHVADR
jgi:hypothetical protein